MPEVITFATSAESAVDRLAYARRVHAAQLEPGARPSRMAELIASTREAEERSAATRALLEALEQEPEWRVVLLACGVLVEPAEDRSFISGPPGPWEAVDRMEAARILARAARRAEDAGAPAIKSPQALLDRLAMPEGPRAPLLSLGDES